MSASRGRRGATSTENRPTQGSAPPAAGTPSGAPPPAKETRDPRDVARLVGFAIVAGLLIAFIVENSGTVTVHFIFGSAHVSLIWALILAAVLGALADRLFVWRRRRRRAHIAAQKAQQGSS
ncbi:MAG TPA: LapA family protein [Acidimicrobiales bacterium]|nr:LapA family protein [Acidimicrobiales bacterium]